MIHNISDLILLFVICLLRNGATQKCQTLENHYGICIPLCDCNSIVLQLTRANISETIKNNIRALQCAFRNGTPYVCCDVDTLYPYEAIVERYTNVKVSEASKLGNLFPTLDKCGIDLSSSVYSIDEVSLFEKPGMVILKYDNNQFGCGGTLLNVRYVLTAASCVTGDIVQKFGKVKSVRFGEHDLNTNPECDYLGRCQHYDEFDVAEIVVSKKFLMNGQHDLALIRLASDIDTVQYQPICLIESMDLNAAPLRVVGWGLTSDGNTLTERKYLEMDLVNQTECYNSIKQLEISGSPLPTHAICTQRQSLSENTVCPLDGGGVLMARTKDYQWTIVGLASYRPNCGDSEVQSLAYFTNISYHLNWIQYNMRP